MGSRVQYQTLSMAGVDPTIYYTNFQSASASVDPSNPAPQFTAGTRAYGSDGSEFIFCQASTSISLGDFVYIDAGTATFPFSAASITTTNVALGTAVAMGATGLILRQSVTYIPANAFFWACTRGNQVPAQTSTLATNAPSVTLYTTTTPGLISSITVTTALALQGIVCINSVAASIPSSVIPPIGTLTTTGFTQGPVVAIMNPRPIQVLLSSTLPASLYVGW